MNTQDEQTPQPDPLVALARQEFASLWLTLREDAIKLGLPPKKIPVVYDAAWKAYLAGRTKK